MSIIATDRRLRRRVSAALSRAAGQVFGNNPIWHFDGSGLYPPLRDVAGGSGKPGLTEHDPSAGVPCTRLLVVARG